MSGFAGVRWVLPAVPAFATACALVVGALSMVDGCGEGVGVLVPADVPEVVEDSPEPLNLVPK